MGPRVTRAMQARLVKQDLWVHLAPQVRGVWTAYKVKWAWRDLKDLKVHEASRVTKARRATREKRASAVGKERLAPGVAQEIQGLRVLRGVAKAGAAGPAFQDFPAMTEMSSLGFPAGLAHTRTQVLGTAPHSLPRSSTFRSRTRQPTRLKAMPSGTQTTIG